MKRASIIACMALILAILPLPHVVAMPLLAPKAQDLGQITSPRDRSSVRGLVPIDGSATHGQFQKYEIHYIPLMGEGEGHVDGPLETDITPDWDYIYSLPMIKRFWCE